MKRKQLTVLIILLLPFCVGAQNVESFFGNIRERIQSGEWIKLNGSVNAQGSFTAVSGIPPRTNPQTYRLSAAITFDILGIKAPFSASISNGNKVYKLPSYAFYGISPSYKWIKIHAGDRTMNFSPYTLSGHHFRGGGVELTPGKFRFSAMYGQLKRAVAEDLDNRQNLETAYKRTGWGIKTGYDDGSNHYLFVLFQAKDDSTSIPALTQLPVNLRPQENTVLGLQIKQTLGSVLSLEADYAFSGQTRNAASSLINEKSIGFLKKMGGLYKPKTSSGYYHAMNTKLNVRTKFGTLNFKYERIDPYFRSLGTLFFANDRENFTAGVNTSLLKKKITLSANAGVEHNNLSAQDDNTNNRFIGMLQASIKAGEKLGVNLSYSNTSATNRLRAVGVPFVQVDSIILVQTNQSANVNVIYNIAASKERKSILMGNLSYQNANSIVNDEVQEDQNTTFVTGQVSYVFGLESDGIEMTTSLLVNSGQFSAATLLTIAPSFSIQKSFLADKIQTGLVAAYSNVLTNGAISNKVFSLTGHGDYTLLERHRISLVFRYVNNQTSQSQSAYPIFSEFSGTLKYGFRF